MSFDIGSIAIASLLIGVIYLFFIRSFDIYEKDPWIKLFLSFLIGGVLSIFFVSIIYQFFEVKHTMIHAIIRIGLPEEFAKFAAFYTIFWIFRKEINEPVDGVIYISSVALGFACIESISYAAASDTPYGLLFMRAIFSVVGHITFSGYMGLALFIHVKVRKNYPGVLFSILIAALGHGLYDGLLFDPRLNFLFKYLYLAIIIFHLYLIRISLNFSWFRDRFDISLFKPDNRKVLSNCIHCNTSAKNLRVSFWKIHPLECSACGNYIFSKHSFKMLLRYFRPAIRPGKFIRRVRKVSDKAGLSFIESNKDLIHHKHYNLFSLAPGELTKWIRSSYLEDRKNVLRMPVSGSFLRLLGFRFLA